MGIFGRRIEQHYGSRAGIPLVTPFAPQDGLVEIVVNDLYPEHDTPKTLTRDTALRIPAVKRSHDIHCSVLSRTPWRQYDDDAEVAVQPTWLVTSRTGTGPRQLRWGVVSDLFLSGWAAIGFTMDGPAQPTDALHIPRSVWWVNPQTGAVEVDESVVPAQYRDLIVAIPLGYGSSGMLTDARESMTAARFIEAAYLDRVRNPIAATDLEVTADQWKQWSPAERKEFRKRYIESRRVEDGAVSMRPDTVKVTNSGNVEATLFESARNGVRLDIANHAGIPASLLEGSRQGGGTDIKYSGVQGGADRNELWDFGLDKYSSAIEDRLSLDDVCPPGQSIRVDASRYLTVPQIATPQTSED